MPHPSPAARSLFEVRHAVWAELHARWGPARSYPFAWRLPELARGAGGLAVARAALALGQTLYALGRFAEVPDKLPGTADLVAAGPELAAALEDLRRRCLWLGGLEVDIPRPEAANSLAQLKSRAYFLFLQDDPVPLPTLAARYLEAAAGAGSPVDGAWALLLAHWARARLGLAVDFAAAHAALAGLHGPAPAEAAHGAGLFAEAAFHLGPAWSRVWLDDALVRVDGFGQHHLKSRLLHLKARALDAAGSLAEADRFLRLARETAERQGAWRYRRAMAL